MFRRPAHVPVVVTASVDAFAVGEDVGRITSWCGKDPNALRCPVV